MESLRWSIVHVVSVSGSSKMARSARRSSFGQVIGACQVRQERCERALAQHLGQRAQPAADQLVSVQHRAENVDEHRSIAPDIALGFHPIEQFLNRGVLGRLALRIQDVGQMPDRGRSRSHKIRKTASSDSVMSCAGRPISLPACSRFV